MVPMPTEDQRFSTQIYGQPTSGSTEPRTGIAYADVQAAPYPSVTDPGLPPVFSPQSGPSAMPPAQIGLPVVSAPQSVPHAMPSAQFPDPTGFPVVSAPQSVPNAMPSAQFPATTGLPVVSAPHSVPNAMPCAQFPAATDLPVVSAPQSVPNAMPCAQFHPFPIVNGSSYPNASVTRLVVHSIQIGLFTLAFPLSMPLELDHSMMNQSTYEGHIKAINSIFAKKSMVSYILLAVSVFFVVASCSYLVSTGDDADGAILFICAVCFAVFLVGAVLAAVPGKRTRDAVRAYVNALQMDSMRWTYEKRIGIKDAMPTKGGEHVVSNLVIEMW